MEIMRSYNFININRVGSFIQKFLRNLFTVEYKFLVAELWIALLRTAKSRMGMLILMEFRS